MRTFRSLASVASIVMLVATAATARAEELSLSNKWRIEVSESAKSDGVIRFRLTPKEGEAIDVEVPIRDGRGENGVARDIKDTFTSALDPERFHSEVDDGEDVLVKRKNHGPSFELRMIESTVKAVRIHVGKE